MSNRIAIDIHERTGFAGGHAFAEAGAYERLVGLGPGSPSIPTRPRRLASSTWTRRRAIAMAWSNSPLISAS